MRTLLRPSEESQLSHLPALYGGSGFFTDELLTSRLTPMRTGEIFGPAQWRVYLSTAEPLCIGTSYRMAPAVLTQQWGTLLLLLCGISTLEILRNDYANDAYQY